MADSATTVSNPLRHRVSIASLLLFYFILLTFTWLLDRSAFTQSVDQLLHDAWVRSAQRAPPDDVVIVAIDPPSLEQLGRWPWSRDLQASLFFRLARAGVRAVALDLLYIEPDNQPANDARLAEAISQLPIVVLPVLTEGRRIRMEYAEKLPIPQITQYAENIGHIYIPLDSDGIARRVHLKSGFRSAHWSILGLALAEALDVAPDTLPGKRLPPPVLSNRLIEDYQVLIPFYGSGGTFKHVSVADVMSDRLPKGFLDGKIVLVGMTATGLGDVLPTAVSSMDKPMPGVELHANVFSALRAGELITALNPDWNYAVAGMLLIAVLLLYLRLPPLWGMICAGMLALLPVLFSFILYRGFDLWYAPLTASIPVMASYFLWSWHRLEFAAGFLQRETGKLTQEVALANVGENRRLVEFFEYASQLLPIEGWEFSSSGASYRGGKPLASTDARLRVEQWSKAGNSWRKRYATRSKLQIGFRLADPELAAQFMAYIDSLSRVRERLPMGRMSGSIERLQSHTYQFKSQLDRLRQLRALSDSIIAGSPAGMIVWNAAGEPVVQNQLASEMLPHLDLSVESLQSFLRRVGLDTDNLESEKITDLVLHRKPLQHNMVEGDSEIVLSFNATGDTLVDRLVSASIVDVSEIRRSERSRAEMVDFLSHDLRSPLVSALYMLQDDDEFPSGTAVDRNHRIEGHINLSLQMIDDLLNIARADNLSADAFEPSLFDAIVDNAIDQLFPQARNVNIRLDVQTRDDDLWVDGDAALLKRALVNVVGNAIKYSPAGSTISVVTERREQQLVCSVIDQGTGIAPDMMDSLFLRFKRGARIAGKIDGIGLGLALVARVVSLHGGTVRAISPGGGTTIEITLPLSTRLASALS